MEGETIRKARLTGDLLLSDRRGLENLEHSLTGCSLQEAQAAVQAAPLSAGIRETLFRLLEKLAREVAGISSLKPKENQT
jgi:hypothetical protein